MTRIKKIYLLEAENNFIDYHYNKYKYQRRLIIDRINERKFLNTTSDQKLAAKMIDSMYEESRNTTNEQKLAKLKASMIKYKK